MIIQAPKHPKKRHPSIINNLINKKKMSFSWIKHLWVKLSRVDSGRNKEELHIERWACAIVDSRMQDLNKRSFCKLIGNHQGVTRRIELLMYQLLQQQYQKFETTKRLGIEFLFFVWENIFFILADVSNFWDTKTASNHNCCIMRTSTRIYYQQVLSPEAIYIFSRIISLKQANVRCHDNLIHISWNSTKNDFERNFQPSIFYSKWMKNNFFESVSPGIWKLVDIMQ